MPCEVKKLVRAVISGVACPVGPPWIETTKGGSSSSGAAKRGLWGEWMTTGTPPSSSTRGRE